VETGKGQPVPAVTYRAHPEQIKPGLKPSFAYLAHLRAGGLLLPADYRAMLEQVETLS
jgi:hypothetical protein